MANSTTSHLLQLPAEIRNRVWEFALGGYTIHIRHNKQHKTTRMFERSICCADEDDIEVAAAVRRCGVYEQHDQIRLPDVGHRNCMTGPACTTFATVISLLSVCRQIHREAALVPYALNTFNFRFLDALLRFSAVLTQSQRGAVESISLHLHESSLRADYHEPSPISSPVGVRNITVFCARDCGLEAMEIALGSYNGFGDRAGLMQRSISRALMKLRARTLKNASVTIYPLQETNFTRHLARSFQVPLADLQQWSSLLEKEMIEDESKG